VTSTVMSAFNACETIQKSLVIRSRRRGLRPEDTRIAILGLFLAHRREMQGISDDIFLLTQNKPSRYT
jgi:hypothetical protein